MRQCYCGNELNTLEEDSKGCVRCGTKICDECKGTHDETLCSECDDYIYIINIST